MSVALDVTELRDRDPHQLEAWFLKGAVTRSEGQVLFDPENIAAAIVDSTGQVIAASPLFAASGHARLVDADLAARALASDRPVILPVDIGRGDAESNSALVAYASARTASTWHLPSVVSQAGAVGHDRAVMIVMAPSQERPLQRACHSFGLTGLQERVVLATIRSGGIKQAAASLGISYVTAREALSAAFRRTGTRRLPELVRRLSLLAFGILPEDDQRDVLLVDVWGLTARQAALAALIADGETREEAARALDHSPAVVKKELDLVYATLQVRSAAGLARTIATVGALSALLRATGGSIGFFSPLVEPLRFLSRGDGTRIAWSDYGPAWARPVLIVHSSMSSRLVPHDLVRALQDRGFRPISIDRPGFGMSDTRAGAKSEDPFTAAARDFILLARSLKVDRIDVVARGGAHFVLALDLLAPGLIGRAILVNPGPPGREDPKYVGTLGAVKRAYAARPAMISVAARVLASQLTSDRISRILAEAIRGSPPDEAALDRPGFIDEFHRSVRMFATGRIAGYVAEQSALARGLEPPVVAGRTDWTVLIGEHDVLHDAGNVERYWRVILPDSQFDRIADAGRFLSVTHAALVADRLGLT